MQVFVRFQSFTIHHTCIEQEVELFSMQMMEQLVQELLLQAAPAPIRRSQAEYL
jgi:hypothetical protein